MTGLAFQFATVELILIIFPVSD